MLSRVEVHSGRYYDSVRLMQASKALLDVPEVTQALVAMATELNLNLLADMGFDTTEATAAGPNDLVLAVQAETETGIANARLAMEGALSARLGPSGGFDPPAPKTIASTAAIDRANIALLSVPGEHAFVEAMEALDSGLHVMIFSDNVSIRHEIELKEQGVDRGLLVMGPDCGTAIVGGLGLGFANSVQPGPVGMVGASGTGIQHMCSLLDDSDLGVSHALGTGSHDLSEEVGALSTLQALSALDADPTTEVISVLSKPPAPSVADKVRTAASALSTPVIITFMGETTLEEGAVEILSQLGEEQRPHGSWPAPLPDHRPGTVRGLFSGGTLRDEARFVAAPLGAIGSREEDAGHTFIDYGDDEYTRGRAHPMIDQTVRIDRLASAARDESIGVVLLDVVLGYGANADPAAELTPEVKAAVDAGAAAVVSLTGTRGDPQGRDSQARALNDAGASVWLSNAAAAREAVRLANEEDET